MKKFFKTNKLFVFGLTLALGVRVYLQLLGKGWGNFDGVHFLSLSQSGYSSGLIEAFFPLYPNLIKFLNFFIHNPFLSGIIISHLCFIGFLYFLIKLIRLDYSASTIRWILLLILLFPTSFFFFSVYSESLFLFLGALCLYLARTRRFIKAALIAGLASAANLAGIFFLPAILWEYHCVHHKIKPLDLIKISLLSASGLLFYLSYLQRHFNNSLIFVVTQNGLDASHSIESITLIYQVIFRYLKMFFGVSLSSDIYPVLVFEFSISLVFLGLIIWALIKKFRPSYLLFIIPSFLLPTLTGSFASMPRYVLTAFPLLFILGANKNKYIKSLICLIFFILLTWSFIRFSRGNWIA